MLTVAEAAQFLKCSRKSVYEQVGQGQLEAIRIGRAIRIPRAVLAEYTGVDVPEPDQREDEAEKIALAREALLRVSELTDALGRLLA